MGSSRLRTGLLAATLGLTACGGDANGGEEASEDNPVELRFAWWGSDHRNTTTQAIIDDFEAEYPHISIEGEWADWAGYQDQLATQVASRDAPDIVQLDDEFIREYADRGALLELTEVDLSELDEAVVEGGQSEGVQYAVPTGVNALVMMANPDLFEEAGLPTGVFNLVHGIGEHAGIHVARGLQLVGAVEAVGKQGLLEAV